MRLFISHGVCRTGLQSALVKGSPGQAQGLCRNTGMRVGPMACEAAANGQPQRVVSGLPGLPWVPISGASSLFSLPLHPIQSLLRSPQLFTPQWLCDLQQRFLWQMLGPVPYNTVLSLHEEMDPGNASLILSPCSLTAAPLKMHWGSQLYLDRVQISPAL